MDVDVCYNVCYNNSKNSSPKEIRKVVKQLSNIHHNFKNHTRNLRLTFKHSPQFQLMTGTKIFLFFCNGFSDAPTMCQKIKFRNFTKSLYKINSQMEQQFSNYKSGQPCARMRGKSAVKTTEKRGRISRYLHFWFSRRT